MINTTMNDNSIFESTAIRYNKEKNEKKGLKTLGAIGGSALLLFVAFQILIGLFLGATHLAKPYFEDSNMTYVLGTLISVFSLGGAFLIAWLFMGKNKRMCLNLGKPYDTGLMLLAVPAGMLICLLANIVTFYFSEFFEAAFGIIFESPDMPMPTNAIGIIGFILQVAVVPALIEEFAIRGVIMMPLRKYGDMFAIVTSAAIFGIMHGNLVQAPFAFIVGIGIGYLVITTGSMWTGVLIHFLNNMFSATISLLYEFIPSTYVNIVYYVATAVFFVLGISCWLLFKIRADEKMIPRNLKKSTTELAGTAKFGRYMLNIPMILALIYLIYTTSHFISFA